MKNKNKLNNMKNKYEVQTDTRDGSKRYYLNGEMHREDGPAIECLDGYKAYYLNGKLLTETEWKHKVSKLEIKKIKYTKSTIDHFRDLSWW